MELIPRRKAGIETEIKPAIIPIDERNNKKNQIDRRRRRRRRQKGEDLLKTDNTAETKFNENPT
jgi:hypothetical protein